MTEERFGPFELIEALGSGGFGTVYRARDRELDRTVAIKLLRKAYAQDERAKRRFERRR